MLELINPKAIIYVLTLYLIFSSSFSVYPMYLVLSAITFCITTFVVISTWPMSSSIVRTQ